MSTKNQAILLQLDSIDYVHKPLLITYSNVEVLVNDFQPLLNQNNIKFKYQRKGCKRGGASKAYYKPQTQEYSYELLIERSYGEIAKINIFIHELMHILLDHFKPRTNNELYLTAAQREFVVDKIADLMTYYLAGQKLTDYSNEFNSSWNPLEYRENWMKKAQISKRKLYIMQAQINLGCSIIQEYIGGINEH